MDITALENDLRTYRPATLDGIPFPEEFVWPRYEGLSVGNVPATIARLLGGATTGILPPLREDLLEGLTDGVQRVVLVIVDALGWEQLQWMLAEDEGLVFHRLARQGRLLPITTVYPSTTNNVLSTVRTGVPPAKHGLLAYELYLREWQMAVECISFSPLVQRSAGLLAEWGFDAEQFLPVPTLANLLAVQGALTYQVIASHLARGPLTRMFFRGSRQIYHHAAASDFWSTARGVLQAHQGERFLLSAYWSAVDTLAHRYGPFHETALNEVHSFFDLLERTFLRELSPADRKGTLLLMVADHGQLLTKTKSSIVLKDHPWLQDALTLAPVGESRTPFFYTHGGQLEAVRAYLQKHFAEQMVVWDRETLLESGLLGPGKPYREVPHRVGDLVGLMRGNAAFVRDKEILQKLQGRHGGLASSEMLVPLLAVRLDA